MHRYSAVLFDFDGTLADTAKDVWDSVRYGFKKNGLSIPDNYAADDRNLALYGVLGVVCVVALGVVIYRRKKSNH